jgi:phage head maturation protease
MQIFVGVDDGRPLSASEHVSRAPQEQHQRDAQHADVSRGDVDQVSQSFVSARN